MRLVGFLSVKMRFLREDVDQIRQSSRFEVECHLFRFSFGSEDGQCGL
jgi:hypothetical protein